MRAHERYKLLIFQIYSVSLFFNFTVLVKKKGEGKAPCYLDIRICVKGCYLLASKDGMTIQL